MTLPIHLAASLRDLPDEIWERLQVELLAQQTGRSIFTPYRDFILRHAFDALQAALLDDAARPPAAPAFFSIPKGNAPDQRGSNHREALMLPTEEALFILLNCAALAAAEPALDRTRVFSSRLAKGSEQGLMTAPSIWSAEMSDAIRAGIGATGAQAVIQIDIANCAGRIDRDALARDLRQLGLSPYWQAVAGDFWASFGSAGLAGLPAVGPRNAGFVTVALRPLDSWCTCQSVRSYRLLDDTVMLVDDMDMGHRLAAAAEVELAAHGLPVNRDKSRVQTMAAFRAGARRKIRSQARPGMSPSQALAALKATPTDDQSYRLVAGAALGRLASAGDASALDHVLECFEAAPTAAKAFAVYIGGFIGDPAVAERMEALFIAGARRFHPWQRTWAIATFNRAPGLSRRLAAHFAGLPARNAAPLPVRMAAAVVGARFATRGDWAGLEVAAAASGSSHLRAAIAYGLRFRPAAQRDPLLRDWGARDPQVALVATALARSRRTGEAAAGPRP